MHVFKLMMMAAGGSFGVIQSLPGDSVVGSPAGLALGTDGIWTKISDFSTGHWVEAPALAPNWEMKVTVTSGSLSSGTTGTWVSSGTWSKNVAGTAVLTFEFREKVSQIVRKTQTGVTIIRS